MSININFGKCQCGNCEWFGKPECPRVDAEAGVMCLQYTSVDSDKERHPSGEHNTTKANIALLQRVDKALDSGCDIHYLTLFLQGDIKAALAQQYHTNLLKPKEDL